MAGRNAALAERRKQRKRSAVAGNGGWTIRLRTAGSRCSSPDAGVDDDDMRNSRYGQVPATVVQRKATVSQTKHAAQRSLTNC